MAPDYVLSAATGALGPVLGKLARLLSEEYLKIKGVRPEVKFLIRELEAMHAFLLKKQEEENLDAQDKAWMKMVRELSYDIEDCIDDFIVNVYDNSMKPDGFIDKCKNLLAKTEGRRRIAKQIEKLKGQVMEVSERHARYKQIGETVMNTSKVTVDPRALAIFQDASRLVGIDQQKQEVISLLTKEDGGISSQHPNIVSILGIGGIGKTTLANRVYEELKDQFQCQVFLTVSRNPDMAKILRSIFRQVAGQSYCEPQAWSMQELIMEINKFLRTKRYFIVIDDLWDVQVWNTIFHAFPENSLHSRVVITTRIEGVARKCSGNHGLIHTMKPLSKANSRKLFFNRIFGSEDACPSEFNQVSSKILEKCGGLPLAIITMASMLASQPLESQLELIHSSLTSGSTTNSKYNDMMHILDLSYKDLPYHLKACFLYLGSYPGGHEISRVDLVRRWVAEGFVSASSGQDVWDNAERCFNELINRSMIEPTFRKHFIGIFGCKVHGILFDLIMRRCEEENFLSFVNDPDAVGKVQDVVIRRLTVVRSRGMKDDTKVTITTGHNLSKIRSLTILGESNWIPPLLEFKFLRVLALQSYHPRFKMDLSSISQLSQLNYVKVEGKVMLPYQIRGLRILQTLDLSEMEVDGITLDIVDVPFLSHLVGPWKMRLPNRIIGEVKSLHTLRGFCLPEDSLESIIGLGEHTALSDLSFYFPNYSTQLVKVKWLAALGTSLEKLGNLRRLHMKCGEVAWCGDVLSSLSPCFHNLEWLSMSGLTFSRAPMWIRHLRSLHTLSLGVKQMQQDDVAIIGIGMPSLVRLTLRIAGVPAETVVIGGSMGFPVVKYFKFDSDSTSNLTFEQGAMPELQELEFLFDLDEWDKAAPIGLQHLPRLKKIKAVIVLYAGSEFRHNDEKAALVRAVFGEAAGALPTCPAFSFKDQARAVRPREEAKDVVNNDPKRRLEIVGSRPVQLLRPSEGFNSQQKDVKCQELPHAAASTQQPAGRAGAEPEPPRHADGKTPTATPSHPKFATSTLPSQTSRPQAMGAGKGGDGGGEAAPEAAQPVVLRMDLQCAGCAPKVKNAIRHVPGVESIVMDVAANRVVVVGTADAGALKARLEAKIGKPVEVVSAGGAPKKPAAAAAAEPKVDKGASPKEEEKEKKQQPEEEKKPKQGETSSTLSINEYPTSSSWGAMGPLLSKLDLLLHSKNQIIQRSAKEAIKLLKEDLEEINTDLVELSMVERPNYKSRYWMDEVRELSYHIEDCIDNMMVMQSRAAAKAKVRFSGRRPQLSFRRHVKILCLPKTVKPFASLGLRRTLILSVSSPLVRHPGFLKRFLLSWRHESRHGAPLAQLHQALLLIRPPPLAERIAELRTMLREASERHERYQLQDSVSSEPRFLFPWNSHAPALSSTSSGAGADLVGVDGTRGKLTSWLIDQTEEEHRQLEVLSIIGPAGVGKTALVKELYRQLGHQFECRAFVRVSRNPDMRRLLVEILAQVQGHKRDYENDAASTADNLMNSIRSHLQDKRYFVVIDELWDAAAWDIMNIAFPKGNNCSRIIITAEGKEVASKCYYVHNLEMTPLGSVQDSAKIFVDRAFGSEHQCPDQLKDISCMIIRSCGGFPLAITTVASLLASQIHNTELWDYLQQCFVSRLTGVKLEETCKEVVNICYDALPQNLKTCLLYLTMYPEGSTIRKADLLNQWIAEGFITPKEGNQKVAESYFAELINRGMIQPEKVSHDDEVLSCTVHHIVFDLIAQKSREENFITAVDYSQAMPGFSMIARRLTLHFSCAQFAAKPEGLKLSQVRSLAFYGLLKCMPPITEFMFLRVLILEFWGDNYHHNTTTFDLSKLCMLFQLRYLKISSHIFIVLPSQIRRLKSLETLEIDAQVSAVPTDILHLPGLLHLSLPNGTELPDGIGRITSLQTLEHFDVGSNSEDNAQSLGELINLQSLHVTCSRAVSDHHLKRNLVALSSSIGKLVNLKSLRVGPFAVGMTMFIDQDDMPCTPKLLQRLELLPSCCIFSRLPTWIGGLEKLCILEIAVRVLLSSDIDTLTGLPVLAVLSLYVQKPNAGSVIFNSGSLPALKYFKYRCAALRLGFQKEALPNLQRLKLCFNVHRAESYTSNLAGIENLLQLKEITAEIGAAAGAHESDMRAAESALKEATRKHPRFPIHMNVKNVDCIEEESTPVGFMHPIPYILGFLALAVIVVVLIMLFWY